jgi:hypothetical protein
LSLLPIIFLYTAKRRNDFAARRRKEFVIPERRNKGIEGFSEDAVCGEAFPKLQILGNAPVSWNVRFIQKSPVIRLTKANGEGKVRAQPPGSGV